MNPFTVRSAVLADFAQILHIYECARNYMARMGNESQWGTTHPPKALILQDMEAGRLYVVEQSGSVHGVFAFQTEPEPTYDVIQDGTWLSDGAYGTIHRVAGDGKVHGIFGAVLSFCEQQKRPLRIDTHEKNQTMQHLIEKHGFQRCGIIHIEDGTPRIAYEKLSTS